ncbi:MAG: family 10 glycosylhydrolase [Bacteroidales bacterium]|nr:family 10 glycosylhydrolase [Bacteroidales bacterium]
MLKKLTISLFLLCFIALGYSQSPKREFRGAWLQTVYQPQYAAMTKSQMENYFVELLDRLQRTGINAVIFQVRPSADAFYDSKLEPWSKYFTGRQGKAPNIKWDPMEFLIEECHKRNMEFHAWLNPYRVTTSKDEVLTFSHIYHKNPEWFVEYGGKIYFNPGLPQSRKFIREVVKDIVSRYDVDAIHMDDYFYPYPVQGEEFQDESTFQAYRKVMGFSENQKDDWRRQNINILIKYIHNDIKELKPWVRFGISPFGIYRNKKSDPNGSDTSGLQCYDNLYADVILWAQQGWIDYMMPQLYWEIGNAAADYSVLVNWWNSNENGVHVYVGQSISRSLDNGQNLTASDSHFTKKINMTRKLENIQGNCFWYGYQIANNESKIASELVGKIHSTPSLIPSYNNIDEKQPEKIKKLKAKWTEKGYTLTWERRETDDELQKQVYFCIYRFENKEKVNLEDGSKIVATTRDNYYVMPYENGKIKYRYVVTAVDRCHNESKKAVDKKVKL